MPRISLWEGSRTYKTTKGLVEIPLLTVLLPCLSRALFPSRKYSSAGKRPCYKDDLPAAGEVDQYFLCALVHLGSCRLRRRESPKTAGASFQQSQQRRLSGCRPATKQSGAGLTKSPARLEISETVSSSKARKPSSQIMLQGSQNIDSDGEELPFKYFYQEVDHQSKPVEQDETRSTGQGKEWIAELQAQLNALENQNRETEARQVGYEELQNLCDSGSPKSTPTEADREGSHEGPEQELLEQIRYLRTVRELEIKLGKARHNLHSSLKNRNKKHKRTYWHEDAYQDQGRIEAMSLAQVEMTVAPRPTVQLKKEDFIDLVDLYFYSHRSRFLSELPDASPTPLQLDDYSFKVSEDFSAPTNPEPDLIRDEEGTPVSPLYHIEAEIKTRKLNEIKALQNFVDLLLDDYSPLKDLFLAYKALPQPGVSFLSGGVIRLFLQRMSTPWKKSEKAMLRYLSLLDDMQLACLPITAWEWSSAIYLAGQSFNVSNSNVSAAFRIWRQMERDAGVAARDVTFNILFDISVKAGKFVLAEEILKEMHDRGFRLNRLGRVSLIYYYGKRGDGDAVRKAYRDFVDAGEIVDTLVLNCVMASLINAQEPVAAEQIYERMKGMQERLQKRTKDDGEEALFLKYPPPGPERIGTEMASNALGRVLLHASRLRTILPEHHAELQNVMPLTPDAITFRTLMSHHAATSGNMNRLTVLLDDMTRQFRVPINHLTFQLLFKGFAIHGGSDRNDAKWTRQRLQITWAACLVCMKAGKAKDAGTSQKESRLGLPSVEDAGIMAAEDERRVREDASKRRKPPRPTAWDTFIKQFTNFYSETKPFDLYATSVDASKDPAEDTGSMGEEYQLPGVALTPQSTSSADAADVSRVRPTKHLVLWVIRAFTRCTTDRSVLEDVWYQIARIWQPWDAKERAVAIRELRRALRYCDTHGKK